MIGEVSAQLITDSDRRLKTQTSKDQPSTGGAPAPSKSPFAAFRKKQEIERRSTSGLQNYFRDKSSVSPRTASNNRSDKTLFPQAKSVPRYSSGSPFKSQPYVSTTPKYSAGNIWTKADRIASPRYSSGKPFESYDFYRSPKYSIGKIWSTKDLNITPRYSKGSPFDGYDFYRSPKYSVGKVWSTKDLNITPRYSKGSPFDGYDFYRSPKYSIGNVWSTKDLNITPRYSKGNPFDGYSFSRAPSYSIGQVWSKKDLNKAPRYSKGDPFDGYSFSRAPSYSVGQVWTKNDLNKTPRYSVGIQWSKNDLNKSPRYSAGEVWSKEDLEKAPRYSVGGPYDGYKFLNVPPQYSTNKNRFEDNTRAEKENRIYELNAGFYIGDFKTNWNKTKEMHPSFNHHNADQSMEMVRESLRKWNIFWVRVNSNEEDPKGVKEKVSKPKFDKKEAEIWNE